MAGIVAGKSGKTEGGGRGEGRSGDAAGGRRCWHTGGGEEGEGGETGSWGGEVHTGRRAEEAGSMSETAC